MLDTQAPITAALAAQRAFLTSGGSRSVEFRLQALRRLREVFVRREEDVYQALEQDLGKPRFEALVSEFGGVRNELDVVIRRLRSWARPKRQPTPWVLLPGRAFIQPEPYGSVLIISPWNYPIDLSLSPLIGAVAAGNVVIIKPSELAPASSRLLAQIVSEVFMPEHVHLLVSEPQRDSLSTAVQALKLSFVRRLEGAVVPTSTLSSRKTGET